MHGWMDGFYLKKKSPELFVPLIGLHAENSELTQPPSRTFSEHNSKVLVKEPKVWSRYCVTAQNFTGMFMWKNSQVQHFKKQLAEDDTKFIHLYNCSTKLMKTQINLIKIVKEHVGGDSAERQAALRGCAGCSVQFFSLVCSKHHSEIQKTSTKDITFNLLTLHSNTY